MMLKEKADRERLKIREEVGVGEDGDRKTTERVGGPGF